MRTLVIPRCVHVDITWLAARCSSAATPRRAPGDAHAPQEAVVNAALCKRSQNAARHEWRPRRRVTSWLQERHHGHDHLPGCCLLQPSHERRPLSCGALRPPTATMRRVAEPRCRTVVGGKHIRDAQHSSQHAVALRQSLCIRSFHRLRFADQSHAAREGTTARRSVPLTSSWCARISAITNPRVSELPISTNQGPSARTTCDHRCSGVEPAIAHTAPPSA